MGNPVVHWELMSKEPQKVAAFYQKVFDWKVDHHPEINYRIVDTLAKGEMKRPLAGQHGSSTSWRRPRRLPQEGRRGGGKIHVEEQKVPGMGKLSLFTDPEGRMMGLWKAKTRG